MSTRDERIDVFRDTLSWIDEDKDLSDSVRAAKKATRVFSKCFSE